MSNGFLPISKADMEEQGIEQLDFVYVTGDAYVDHPSFGHAIISRILQSHGYTVGIIAQPDWKDDKSISILGAPRLGFLVSAGNMDYSWQYGFYGQPLFRVKKTKTKRFIYPGR